MPLSLTILGSNAAVPAHQRNQTAQFLAVMHHAFLIDCGEGTQLRLKKYNIRANRIDHIMISHLHGDHYYGLIGLMSSMHLYGRKKELNMYGPPGLLEIISIQLKYSDTSLNFPVNFKEWTPNVSELIFENEHLTVHTIPLDHRVDCSGFLFQEKPKKRRIDKEKSSGDLSPLQIISLKNGKDLHDKDGNFIAKNSEMTNDPHPSYSYAYCSDTKFDENIAKQIKGVDLLYHESTFMHDMLDRATNTYHTTTVQAGEMAKLADAGKLIIGHFSTRYKELEPLIEETREVFPNSELAIEGKVFQLGQQ
ncbi:MAG: ribonuclease Z [Cyclobacteriaceae bacterium]